MNGDDTTEVSTYAFSNSLIFEKKASESFAKWANTKFILGLYIVKADFFRFLLGGFEYKPGY